MKEVDGFKLVCGFRGWLVGDGFKKAYVRGREDSGREDLVIVLCVVYYFWVGIVVDYGFSLVRFFTF